MKFAGVLSYIIQLSHKLVKLKMGIKKKKKKRVLILRLNSPPVSNTISYQLTWEADVFALSVKDCWRINTIVEKLTRDKIDHHTKNESQHSLFYIRQIPSTFMDVLIRIGYFCLIYMLFFQSLFNSSQNS